MSKPKPMFKINEMFFHPEQKVFVTIDTMQYFMGEDKGWLYALKVFNHNTGETKPWKRYYEHKVIDVLQKLKNQHGTKVLFGENGDTSS